MRDWSCITSIAPLEEKPKDALAPHCVKDEIEERLFQRFSDMFMDTTSLSFYGEGGETLDENGPYMRERILQMPILRHFE